MATVLYNTKQNLRVKYPKGTYEVNAHGRVFIPRPSHSSVRVSCRRERALPLAGGHRARGVSHAARAACHDLRLATLRLVLLRLHLVLPPRAVPELARVPVVRSARRDRLECRGPRLLLRHALRSQAESLRRRQGGGRDIGGRRDAATGVAERAPARRRRSRVRSRKALRTSPARPPRRRPSSLPPLPRPQALTVRGGPSSR